MAGHRESKQESAENLGAPLSATAGASMYRRPLPATLIPFASTEGRAVFSEALAAGSMQGYFSLAEQFHTQGEPAFCGLGTLVIVLNALSIDPGRTWKGNWRWFAEDMLDCCRPLDDIKEHGITLAEFVCLAKCNGAEAKSFRPTEASLDEFRATVQDAASRPGDLHVVAAYDRKALGQTGGGHFSPIGGYHAARDLALVLDVARFKYPPYWVPLEHLWSAFFPHDLTTGKSRGYVRLERGASTSPVLCNLYAECTSNETKKATTQARRPAGVEWLFGSLPPIMTALTMRQPPHLDSDGDLSNRAALLAEVRATALFQAIAPTTPAPLSAEVATLLVFAAPSSLWAMFPSSARAELGPLRDLSALPQLLLAEISALGAQLRTLSDYCREG